MSVPFKGVRMVGIEPYEYLQVQPRMEHHYKLTS